MAANFNVYKTNSYADAYSEDGIHDDPIFPYPPNDFDGDIGQVRDVELFGRNDGSTDLKDGEIEPTDQDLLGREIWMKLATTQAGLDSATGGANLVVPDLIPTNTFIFWLRITIPAGTNFISIKSRVIPRYRSKQFA